MVTEDKPYRVSFELPFDTEEHATIASRTLKVDAEPKRSATERHFQVDNHLLRVEIRSCEPKYLRVAANALLDHLQLIIETIELFKLENFQ